MTARCSATFVSFNIQHIWMTAITTPSHYIFYENIQYQYFYCYSYVDRIATHTNLILLLNPLCAQLL